MYYISGKPYPEEFDEFVPIPDSDGRCRNWGVEGLDFPYRFSPERMEKLKPRFEWQGAANNAKGILPEEIAAKKLSLRRQKQIEKAREVPEKAELLRHWFVVDIDFQVVEPKVFRRVLIPGGLALHTFADKVIHPAMGWARGYHAYLFQDLRDGSCFGHPNQHADEIFLFAHTYTMLDDSKVFVADLLTQVGDSIEFTHDLGARWMHTITLRSILPPAPSEVKDDAAMRAALLLTEKVSLPEFEDDRYTVVCLAGAGACPPEDGNGIADEHMQMIMAGPGNQKKDGMSVFRVDELYLQECGNEVYKRSISAMSGCLGNPKHLKYKEKNKDIMLAENYKQKNMSCRAAVAGKYFNPFAFDLELVNINLKMQMGTALYLCTCGNLGTCLYCQGGGKKPGKQEMCAKCGATATSLGLKSLMRCAACSAVRYCSRECQKSDWPSHKKQCSNLRPATGYTPQVLTPLNSKK